MSYLETLQQHNTSLQSLIDTVNALPEAGSGSDGSVETCTVNITNDMTYDSSLFAVSAMVYVDGTYRLYSYVPTGTTHEVTIQNVVCGSRVQFSARLYYYVPYVEIEGGAVLDKTTNYVDDIFTVCFEIIAPTADGSSTTIHYFYEP